MEPGSVQATYDLVFNAPLRQMEENVRHSSSLDLPWISPLPVTGRRVVICAAGPSLEDTLPFIKKEQESGSFIMAINGTAHWLVDHGLIPDALVMVDCSKDYIKHVEKRPAYQYYLASQVDGGIFDSLREENVTLFHLAVDGIESLVGDNPQALHSIGGGPTAGLIAMSLAYVLGYRDIHLHGYDSSYRKDAGHVYPQKEVTPVEVTVYDRTFCSAPWMIHQAEQWQILVDTLTRFGCTITTHGNGLIPYIAWMKSLQS